MADRMIDVLLFVHLTKHAGVFEANEAIENLNNKMADHK